MRREFKARAAVSLILSLFFISTGRPVSAAELRPALPSLGEFTGLGNVLVGGSPVDSGKLVDGDRISTSDLSSAKVVLLNGNRIELSSKTDLVVARIGTGEDVRVSLSSGSVAFTAANTHVGIAIGQLEIFPEAGSSGSVSFMDGDRAALHVETGSVKLHDPEDENNDVVLSGKSDRTLALRRDQSGSPPAQIAA